MSLAPPRTNGTPIVTRRSGYSAWLGRTRAAIATIAAASLKIMRALPSRALGKIVESTREPSQARRFSGFHESHDLADKTIPCRIRFENQVVAAFQRNKTRAGDPGG